ncbi:MAG: PAS domain S-box protein [Flavobacterium sp.]|nr:PAS domain S-box protein [Flavobacterium sp.]
MPSSENISLHFSTRQFEILLNLYKSSFSSFNSLQVLHEQITKAISQGLDISRASIWEFEGNLLECRILYDADVDSLVDQDDLKQVDFPNYFEALQKGIAIVAEDAQTHLDTKDLKEIYLIPLQIKSMLDIPIRENGKLVGILCCENTKAFKNWTENDISFARSVTDILSLFTEEYKRKLVEQSLLENQDRFKFISENISDGIYIIENDKLVFASKTYLEMIGMTSDEKHESHNKDMFHLTHPEDKERVIKTIYDAASKKLPSVKYTFRCNKKDGGFMWREDIMNIHYDVSGHAFRAVTIARDITEEKNQELELIKKQQDYELQNKLLLDFYASYTESSFDAKIVEVTIIAVKGLLLDRASYWEITQDELICKNLYDKIENTHTKNQILVTKDIPNYINAIRNQTAIVADDVYTNVNTTELVESYFTPLGITDLLDIPIRVNGKLDGVLCCEHRDQARSWSENDISFARALADYLSLAIEQEKRKSAELKLRENQKKIEFISENTSDGIIIIENATITYVSPAYAKLSGYELAFIQNLSLEEMFTFIHPEDVVEMKTNVYKNLENKITKFNYEYRFLGPEGSYQWREDSVSVIYKENSGEYSKYIIISRDIQQRKTTELKLKESEQQLRLIFENTTDGFVVIENQSLKYISPSYRKFLGFDKVDLENFPVKSIFDLIHPDHSQKVMHFIGENIKNKVTSFTSEFRIKGKDGNYHWREDLANIIYNPDGSYSKYIITSRDIQERKEIEEQLIESEKQLRLITENTSDGVAVIEGGNMTYVSPSFLQLLGYDKDFYKGMTLQDVFLSMHPDDVDRVMKTVYDGLANQQTEIKYEHRFKGNDGAYYWREDSANVIYDEKGKYTKYIVVTRDISARKEAEKEKNRLYKITEKQNEKLINFTHIVSHDIRSHTSNLSMILDLYEETEDKDEQKEYFRMLKQSTSKLSETIFYLNETVAIQSGMKNEKTTLNLKNEIEKALVGINAIVLTNNAKVTITVDSAIEIIAIQSYLESIIFNLLTNAIKYKSPDRNPEIKITAVKVGEEIKFSIADNGIGIDLEKNKDKIFGMYKTFHGNPDAVGLGLFMVKNHIESMGGRIEIESQVNVGTIFNLYFI